MDFQKRDTIIGLFDAFNEAFSQAADRHGLVFELRAGPNIGRALRFKNDRLQRGVFLELKEHWTTSDMLNPSVVFGYGARLQPKGSGLPVYFLGKSFFDGSLESLKPTIHQKLEAAISELKLLREEIVIRDGEFLDHFPP